MTLDNDGEEVRPDLKRQKAVLEESLDAPFDPEKSRWLDEINGLLTCST